MSGQYQKSRVGTIPIDWKCPQLVDLIKDISMGPFGSDITVANFTSSGVPVLNGRNISAIRLNDDIANYVSVTKAKNLKKAVAHRGDVVVTHRGTLGQISYISEDSKYNEYVISQSQFRVTFNPKVDVRFLVYFFHTTHGQSYLLEGKGHTGVPAIAQPTTTFRKLYIPLPEKGEQQKIAEALSDADSLIASLQKLIAKKKAIKQGAMQELLTGRRRLPGFSGEWRTKKIGEILTVGHGQNPHAVENPYGFYPILATGGKIGQATSFIYDKASVLIGRKGTINKPQYIDIPFWTIDTLFYTIIHEGYSEKFVYYRFCLIDWMRYNEASGVPSLNAKTIENIEIKTPSYSEQLAIAQILSDMDAEIEQLEKKLSKYQQIKQGMMQELLTGRIRLLVKARSYANDAVILSDIVSSLYSDEPQKYPLGRKKVQKVMYFLLRREKQDVSDFMKMAAGPYSPSVRYNSEPIAIERGYIRTENSDKGTIFSTGENIAHAQKHMKILVAEENTRWLVANFKHMPVNDLELFATVDMAICDLRKIGKPVSVQTIKELIQSTKEWREKLAKTYFSDEDIQKAINKCREFFGEQ